MHIFNRYTPILVSASSAVSLCLVLFADLPYDEMKFYATIGLFNASIGWMLTFLTEEKMRELLETILEAVSQER
jgi:hypothetical protein